jgi:hypothetical protein
MAGVTPKSEADAVRLGLRDSFVVGSVDGGTEFVSHVSNPGASCTVAPPGCLSPTFPLYLNDSVGEATPQLGQTLIAQVAFNSDATIISIDPPLEMGIAGISALPVQSVALQRIELHDAVLRYQAIAMASGFHFPLTLDLMLSGHCPSTVN